MEYQIGCKYFVGSKSRDNQQKRKQWKITSRFFTTQKVNCIFHVNISGHCNLFWNKFILSSKGSAMPVLFVRFLQFSEIFSTEITVCKKTSNKVLWSWWHKLLHNISLQFCHYMREKYSFIAAYFESIK